MIDTRSEKIRIKSSFNMTAAILLVSILVVVTSLLSLRHYIRWDLTSTGEHTLSEKTLQVLKTIHEPVEIKAFVKEGFQEADDAERILSAYRYASPHIHYEIIDPDRNPAITRRYNVRSTNTFILEGYKRSQTVKIADEENLTTGLIRLSKEERQMVYWVTGHGERMFKGSEPESLSIIQENLTKENHQFEEINIMQMDIPGDASLVIVAAPEKPLFAEEIGSLRRYLNKGGSLIVFLEPFMDAGLKDFLKEYGIAIANDIIVDKLSRAMGGDYLLPIVTQYGIHEITMNFRTSSFFNTARSVEEDKEKKRGVSLTSLGYTSSNSWAETDRQALDVKKENDEKWDKGDNPIEITGEGRLAVFGDIDFASNKFFNFSGNGDFITNTINYMVGRKDLITIKKKHRPTEPLLLTRNQGIILFWIPVVVIPLVVLTLGIVVWNRRRSR
ncbi:MAG: GldG family protein [Deltaproteobacteria bacterium]|nr:GldG family protein [Deltaproteobacteria bacterium]